MGTPPAEVEHPEDLLYKRVIIDDIHPSHSDVKSQRKGEEGFVMDVKNDECQVTYKSDKDAACLWWNYSWLEKIEEPDDEEVYGWGSAAKPGCYRIEPTRPMYPMYARFYEHEDQCYMYEWGSDELPEVQTLNQIRELAEGQLWNVYRVPCSSTKFGNTPY